MGGDMVPLLLYLFVGFSAVEGWRPKQEYNFELNGRTLAYIPSLGNENTGIHYRGQLRVQSYSVNVLFMQLRNLSYVRLQSSMDDAWLDNLPETEEGYRSIPFTDSTFSVKLKNGMVDNLVITSTLENWEINFIQGVVSHLQFDLTGSQARHNPRSNDMHGKGDYENASVYTIMEDAVSGRCEVQYQVNALPKSVMWANPYWAARGDLCGSRPFMEVVKSRNYSSCDKNPEFHFGLPHSPSCEPGSDQCGDLWSRASLTQMVGCGTRKDFMLLTVVSSGKVVANLHLHNGTEAAVQSNFNLTLISAKTLSRKLGLPTAPTRSLQGLTYRYREPYSQVYDSTPHADVFRPIKSLEISEESLELPVHHGKTGLDHHHHHSSKHKHKHPRHKREGKKNSKKTSKKTSKKPSYDSLPDLSLDSVKFVDSVDSLESLESVDYLESLESLEMEKPEVWNIHPINYHRPSFRPFSSFALSHSEGDAHSCMNQQFKELLADIASSMEIPKQIHDKKTLEKVILAVDMCRTMLLVDLRKAHGGIMDVASRENKLLQTERKVLMDIYTMCGSTPAFAIVKSWLIQKKITGSEAAEVIASLPGNLQTPTDGVVDQFYELARNPALAYDEQVKISAVLAFSNLLRVACVRTQYRDARYPTQLMDSVCTPETAARYIPWLASQMRSDTALRRVFLVALGNTAHPSAVQYLQSVAEDSSMTAYVRTTAVFSMKYLVFTDPEGMSQVLMALYNNYNNPISVRMAALSLLMYTRPGLSIWQRIAMSTWYEPSPAMVSFVWTSLKSMAEAEDITYQTMFESAKAVMPLAKPAPLGTHLPENIIWTTVRQELRNVIQDQLSLNNDVHASHLYLRHTQRLGKISRVVSQVELSAANPDDLLRLLLEFMTPKSDPHTARPPLEKLDHTTRWIHEKLKIAARVLPRVEGDLHFKFNNLHERIIRFDKDIIKDTLKASRKAVEKIKAGVDFHYQKMGQEEMEIGTTNDMGFPISLRVKRMWAIRSIGDAKISSDNMNLTANFSLMYASQLMPILTAFPQWDGMEYTAGSYATTFFNLPTVQLKTKINKAANRLQFDLRFVNTSSDVKLLHYNKPFIAYRDLLVLTPTTLSSKTHFFPLTAQKEVISTHHMTISYASNGQPYTLLGWLKNGVFIYGSPMMWHTLKPAFFKVELGDLPRIQANFSIVSAELNKTDFNVKRFFSPPENTTVEDTLPSDVATSVSTTVSSNVESTASTTESPAEPIEAESVTTSSEEKVESTSTTIETTTQTPAPDTTVTTTSTPTSTTGDIHEEVPESNVEEHESSVIADIGPKSDEDFHASTLDPFSHLSGDYFKYFIGDLLSNLKYAEAIATEVNCTIFSEKPKKYRAFFAFGHALGRNTMRSAIFIRNNESNWQMGVTGDLYLPPAPLLDINEMLTENASVKLTVNFAEHSKNESSVATLQVSASHSDERIMNLRDSEDINQCLDKVKNEGASAFVHASCRNAAHLAAFNDFIVTHFTLQPNSREHFPFGWANGSTDAIIKLSDNADTADIWMRTSIKEVEYNGIRLPIFLSNVLRQYNPELSAWDQLLGTGYCGVTPANITTYDGVHFPYKLDSCWHVLTKDCSGKSRVAVLGRLEKNDTVVEINVDNFKIISLLPELRIIVNEKALSLSPNQVTELEDLDGKMIARISVSPDKDIKVRLPEHDLTVIYGYSSVLISAGFGTRGRLCGICGDHDDEILEEMKNPYGTLEKYGQKFARSYALRGEYCDVHKPLLLSTVTSRGGGEQQLQSISCPTL